MRFEPVKVAFLNAVLFGVMVAACHDSHSSKSRDTDTDSGNDADSNTISDSESEDADTLSGGDTDDETDSSSDSDGGCLSDLDTYGGPLFDQMREGFVVRLWEDQGSLDGGVLSAHPLRFHQEADRIGDCRLMTYEGASCSDDCGYDGKLCFNGQCVSNFGTLIPADPVVLRDSKGFERTIPMAASGGYFYNSGALSLPETEWVSLDAVVDGQSVSLSTCVPKPFSLDSSSLEESIGDWEPGDDLVLRWSDVEPGARIYLHMTTGIGSHGGISPVEIECEGQDKGELVIAASFLSALACPECWSCGECGYHSLVRYHTGEATVEGKTVRLNNIQSIGFGFFPF